MLGFQNKCKTLGKLINFHIGLTLICCNVCKVITACLATCFDHCLKVMLSFIWSGNKIAYRHSHSYGSMPITKVSVIIHLESSSHGMVRNYKCIHYGITFLNIIPQERIKAIFVYTFFRNSTTKTPKASSPKRILADIHNSTFIGKLHP